MVRTRDFDSRDAGSMPAVPVALVAELADATDLKSVELIPRVGSSPTESIHTRTTGYGVKSEWGQLL